MTMSLVAAAAVVSGTLDLKQINLLSLKNLDCASVRFLYCG